MDTIGIHIRAKANLEEVESAARKLENFGGSASQAGSKVQQLVESVKDSAGTDINQLTQQIEALQKKIQQPGMSDKERKHSKEELNNLKDQIKELRMLQRIKADDFGSMEQETRLYLEHLKNKKALTNAEKEHIKEIEKGLAYLDKYNKSKLDLDEAHLNKMQKDLQAQEEQAQKAGLNLGGMGAYGGRMVKQITGLVIGGSIIAIAVQAVKKWADLDTQITKTGVSLDGLSKNSVEGITRIGNALGYTKEEGLAYLDVLTAISGIINDTEIGGFKNLLTYGRGTGVGGQTGVQMREIQRWSGEGVKPGTDKYFLSQFTAIARMLSMREGRMTEFIETAIELTKTMEKTFIKVDEKDIFRNILFPSMVFGGSDRGRGQRGLSFMQRLNENVGGGGDLMDLMMYRTIGVPQNWEQMWNLKKVREQGVFGTIEPGGEPLIMGLIRNFEKMFGGEEYINANKDIRDEYEETGEKLILDDNTQKMYNEKRARIMASMKSAMPGISTVEIEEMYKMYEGLQRGNWSMQIGSLSKEVQNKLAGQGIEYKNGAITNLSEEDFKILVNQFPKIIEDFNKKENISAGEKWKVAIENMQYSIGGLFGQSTIQLLTGMAISVDTIASRMSDDTGYVSQKDKILEAGLMFDNSIKRQKRMTPDGEDLSNIFNYDYSALETQIREKSLKGNLVRRWINDLQMKTERENLVDEFITNNPKMSEEEITKQIKMLDEFITDQVDKEMNIKLIHEYKSNLGSKYLALTDVKEKLSGTDEKGFKNSNLVVRQQTLEADISALKLELSKLQNAIDPNPKIPEDDNSKITTTKEIKAEKLIISSPFDQSPKSSMQLNYNFKIDGGDIKYLKRDPNTGQYEIGLLTGPTDNRD